MTNVCDKWGVSKRKAKSFTFRQQHFSSLTQHRLDYILNALVCYHSLILLHSKHQKRLEFTET